MSFAFTLVNAAWLRLLRREPQACAEQAEIVIAYSPEQAPFWMPHGLLLRGWALAEQGQLEQGIADIEQGLASMTAMGTNRSKRALRPPRSGHGPCRPYRRGAGSDGAVQGIGPRHR